MANTFVQFEGISAISDSLYLVSFRLGFLWAKDITVSWQVKAEGESLDTIYSIACKELSEEMKTLSNAFSTMTD